MALGTYVQWADYAWNPIRGCLKVSASCENCFAVHYANRFAGEGQPYEGLAGRRGGIVDWTGESRFVESALKVPYRWRKGKIIAVSTVGDFFFHSDPKNLDRIMAVIAENPQHAFYITTKYVGYMSHYMNNARRRAAIESVLGKPIDWPLPNLALGVSVGNQTEYDQRAEKLRRTVAAWRAIAFVPLLSEVIPDPRDENYIHHYIVGGEVGARARPTNPNYVRRIRDDALTYKIPLFFAGWGEWAPLNQVAGLNLLGIRNELPSHIWGQWADSDTSYRLGKDRTGASLDGVYWREYPLSLLRRPIAPQRPRRRRAKAGEALTK